jgi:hypothetical protein
MPHFIAIEREKKQREHDFVMIEIIECRRVDPTDKRKSTRKKFYEAFDLSFTFEKKRSNKLTIFLQKVIDILKSNEK